MIVLYLHQYFNTPAMSGGTRSFEVARRLVEKGHRVIMVTSRRDTGPAGWQVSHEAGVEVHWYRAPYSNSMGFFSRAKAFLSFALAAARHVTRIRCDVIFATSTPLTIALPALWKRLLSRVPMVFEVRDLWPELPIATGAIRNPVLIAGLRFLERHTYFRSEGVIALSPGMRDGIVATGYPKERVCVVPNACDIESFQSADINVEKFRKERPWLGQRSLIIYAGTLGHINGVDYIVHLAKAVLQLNPDVRFLIVGDGMDFAKIHDLAIECGVLDTNLFMEPPVTKAEVATLFAAAEISCSLFIDLPEMRANSANKFFDALASGTPVLLNYGGWQADLVSEADAGLITWQDPLPVAASKVVNFLDDKRRLSLAGQAAFNLAIDAFDRDLLVSNLISALELCLDRNGSRLENISQHSED